MQYIKIPGKGKVQGGMRLAGKASHSLSPGFILVLNIVPSVLVLYVKNQAESWGLRGEKNELKRL